MSYYLYTLFKYNNQFEHEVLSSRSCTTRDMRGGRQLSVERIEHCYQWYYNKGTT